MITQTGQAINFMGRFTSAGQPATRRTITCDVWGTANTEVVTGAAATEIGDGIYTYVLASGLNTTTGVINAIFTGTDLTLDSLVAVDSAQVGLDGIAATIFATKPDGTNTLTSIMATLQAFLAAYASALATQAQATSILSAISALTPPANSTITSIWGDVQTILTDVAGAETASDMATKYSALQTAIAGVISSVESNLDGNISTILADLGNLASSLSVLTPTTIETAVWANMPSALQTLLGWSPGQVTELTTEALGAIAEAIPPPDVSELALESDVLIVKTAVNQLNGKITSGQQISVVSPVASDGSITLYRGNSYDPAGITGRECAIPCSTVGNPSNLAGMSYTISLPGLAGIALPTPIIDTVNELITFNLSLTVDQTNQLYLGVGAFKIVGTIDSEHATDFVHEGVCNVS